MKTMQIELIPSLRALHQLYAKPADRARFGVSQMIATDQKGGREIALPLRHINPMRKAHCLEAVAALLEIDADGAAAGYPQLGLPGRAGEAPALEGALHSTVAPEDALLSPPGALS